MIKRFCLLMVCLPFLSFLPYTPLQTVAYTTLTTFIATYVVFVNFPVLIQIYHSSPLFYNDLADHSQDDPVAKERFQVVFIYFIQIFGALITGLDYIYRYQSTKLTSFEMGVVGFLSPLSKIETITAKMFLTLLNTIKIFLDPGTQTIQAEMKS